LRADLLKLSLEALSSLGDVTQDITQTRKNEIRPTLSKEFQGICSSQNKPSEWLFGDNIADQLKASKATANVLKATIPRPNFRHVPYNRGGGNRSLNFRGAFFRGRGGQNNQSRQFNSHQFRFPLRNKQQQQSPNFQQFQRK